jgi:hypothetical protein
MPAQFMPFFAAIVLQTLRIEAFKRRERKDNRARKENRARRQIPVVTSGLLLE